MPEAVIVAAGRTPIGRADKGSLVECRPDDLAGPGGAGGAGTACRRWTRARSSDVLMGLRAGRPGVRLRRGHVAVGILAGMGDVRRAPP